MTYSWLPFRYQPECWSSGSVDFGVVVTFDDGSTPILELAKSVRKLPPETVRSIARFWHSVELLVADLRDNGQLTTSAIYDAIPDRGAAISPGRPNHERSDASRAEIRKMFRKALANGKIESSNQPPTISPRFLPDPS